MSTSSAPSPTRRDRRCRESLLSRGLEDAAASAATGTVRPHISATIPSEVDAINSALTKMKAGESVLGKIAVIVDQGARGMSASLRSESPCITAALRAASRRLTLLNDEVMATSGLRITQFNLLAELERRDASPPTVGELAEILTMERSALGQTLKPLERDG